MIDKLMKDISVRMNVLMDDMSLLVKAIKEKEVIIRSASETVLKDTKKIKEKTVKKPKKVKNDNPDNIDKKLAFESGFGINCRTLEEAKKLLRYAHKCGLKWCSGLSYNKYIHWDTYKENTVYIFGGNGSKSYGSYGYQDIAYTEPEDIKVFKEIVIGYKAPNTKRTRSSKGSIGTKNAAKLTAEQVRGIRKIATCNNYHSKTKKQKVAFKKKQARLYNVSVTCIYCILDNRTWKNL